MSEDGKYRKRYLYYKNKCAEMTLQIEKMETAIEGCRALLRGSSGIATPSLSPVFVSTPIRIAPVVLTPKTAPQVQRKISFTSASNISDNSLCLMEPGANKYECLSDKELQDLGWLDRNPSSDPDETFFEEHSQVEQNKSNDQPNHSQPTKTPVKTILECNFGKNDGIKSTQFRGKTTELCSGNGAPIKPNTRSTSKRDESRKVQTPRSSKRLKKMKTPEHICRLPYCPDHQPIYVSSKRKMAKLTPKIRKMATNVHVKSPKNYWDLNMPSTQFIRSRNQSQSQDQEERKE